MEVHPEVYRWLGALHLVDGSAPPPPLTRSGKVLLHDEAGYSFENGQVKLKCAWLKFLLSHFAMHFSLPTGGGVKRPGGGWRGAETPAPRRVAGYQRDAAPGYASAFAAF